MNRLVDEAIVDSSELQLARHLLARMSLRGSIKPELVRSWILPSQRIGGDVVAVAYTPANELNVLVADPAGHGLAAVISALPMIDVFYSMCEKGFSLSSIARELNRKAHFLLPADRFLAAAIVSVNYADNTLRIWNGGAPTVRFVTQDGTIAREWPAAHPPLGVLDDAAFDSTAQAYLWQTHGEVMLFSDSLPNAQDGHHVALGMPRILSLLRAPNVSGRFENLVNSIRQHIGTAPQDDDLCIVSVHCGDMPLRQESVAPTEQPSTSLSPTEPCWRLNLVLSANQLRQVDTMPLVMSWLDQMHLPAQHKSQAFLVLGELFNNALDHGLLRLDSALKQGLDGFEDYLAVRAARLEALQEASIEIDLQCFNTEHQRRLRIRVRDSGPGFDHTAILNRKSADSHQFCGRGIMLVRRICQQLEYSERGDEAIAIYALD